MTMSRLKNEMRQQALLAMQGMSKPRLGLVSSYDPDNYTVKVRVQPEDVETGWLPLQSTWAGNMWGVFAPPSPGDQVTVIFQESSPETGIVIGSLFSDLHRPLPVPAGELWIVDQNASALKFHTDGSVELVTKQNLKATIGGDLQATVTGKVTASATEFDLTGPVNVTGDVAVSGKVTAQGDVTGQGTSLHGHTHKGVQSGSSSSGPPN